MNQTVTTNNSNSTVSITYSSLGRRSDPPGAGVREPVVVTPPRDAGGMVLPIPEHTEEVHT